MSVSAPDLGRVDEQMASLEHCVMIDPFLSESALRHATVVLPGTTFAEEEGTVTTIEGRVVRCDQAVAPEPRARRHRRDPQPCPPPRRRPPVRLRPRTRGVRGDARRLGRRAERLCRHHVGARLAPVCSGRARPSGIRARRGCTRIGSPIPTGGPASTRSRSCAPPVVVDAEYPLVLTTGRLLAHYLSGNQTKRIPAQQQKAPGPLRRAAPRHRPSARPGPRGSRRTDEPAGSLDRAVEAERATAHRHRVHAVPLEGVQRADRRRPRPDEQDPRVQVHPDPCQPAALA